MPLATYVDPVHVNDEIPSDAEVEAEVLCLRLHRAGGQTHLCSEQFKQWQMDAYPGENSKTPPRMELLVCLADIVHYMWRTGDIPQDLGCTVLVLIPKGTTDTWGIGLLETLCKVVEALTDTRLRARIQFHGVLHGFRDRRGTGTDIMELNISQELSRIDQDPLFLIFLDLSN